MKQLILDTVKNLVTDFLYYHRKEDEELSVDQLKSAFQNGEISIDEIVSTFREELTKQVVGE